MVQLPVRGLHVGGGQDDQVVPRRVGQVLHPHVPAGAGALVQGPGEPAVAELVDPAAGAGVGEDGAEHLEGGQVEPVVSPLRQPVGDLHQLVRAVTGEGDPGAEARRQAGVAAQEPVRVVRIAGQHDDQPVPVVLGPLEQRLHRLGAERVAALVADVVQRVGLVDEQHAAHGRVDQLVGLDGGRAEVLAHQVAPVRLDHLGPDQQPVRGEDAAEDARYRGLAGARRAGEDEVPGRGLAVQPLPAAHLRHPQLRGDGADLLLHRVQADQPVEFGQRAFHRRRVLVAAQPAGELSVALLQVARPDGEQVLLRAVRRAGDDAHVAGLAGLLDQAPDEPAVAQVVGDPTAADLLELAVEHRPRVRVEPLPAPLDRGLGQRHHLVRGVTRELQPGREPGGQAGVGGQE